MRRKTTRTKRPTAKRVNPRYLISRDGVEVGIYPGFTSVEAVKRAKAQHGRGTYTAEKIGADMYLGRGGEDIAARERLERQREYRAERLRTKKPNPPYSIEHKAPTSTTGAPAYDLTLIYPGDVYQHPEWYDSEPEAMKIHRMLRTARNKPKAKLTVYRAIPKGIKSGINPGDWITLSRQYANLHGQKVFGAKNYQILKATIPAAYIWFDGNSILESGFDNSIKNPRKTKYILPWEDPHLYKKCNIETQFINYLLTGNASNLSSDERSAADRFLYEVLPPGFWVKTDIVKSAWGDILGEIAPCRVMEYWTGNKKYFKPVRNGTHIHAENIDHLDVSKVHNPDANRNKAAYYRLLHIYGGKANIPTLSYFLRDIKTADQDYRRITGGASPPTLRALNIDPGPGGTTEDTLAMVKARYHHMENTLGTYSALSEMDSISQMLIQDAHMAESRLNDAMEENPARPVRRMAYTLGTWWQPFIEYGDDSDVSIEEIAQWDAFKKRLEPGGHWSFNEDTYFGKDDVTGKRGDVSDAVYVIVG